MKKQTRRMEKVHFTVDPDGFTERVREFWKEGRAGFALKLLIDGMGMSLEQALSVATGAKKLQSDDGVHFTITDDDTKVTPLIQIENLVGLLDRLDAMEKEVKKFEPIQNFKSIIHAANGTPASRGRNIGRKVYGTPVGLITPSYAIEFLARYIDEPEPEEWEKFWDAYGGEIEDDKEEIGGTFLNAGPDEHRLSAVADNRDAEDALANQWSKHTATNVDVHLAHLKQLDRMKAPKPDTTFKSKDGWITPDGKFYPCRYMEHIWLADKLKGLEEREAELQGWIKISDALMVGQRIVKGAKEPTQKQIDTLFDWCAANDFPLPEWAGGKD